MKKRARKKAPNKAVIYEHDESVEYFTPDNPSHPIRSLVQRALGSLRLDPCTHPRNPMGATVFRTKRNNSLTYPWSIEFHNVPIELRTAYMNSPFGKRKGKLAKDAERVIIVPWLRAWHELVEQVAGLRGITLVPSRPGASWYKDHTARCTFFVELDGRVTFDVWNGRRFVPAEDPARWGVTLCYFGADPGDRVRKLFAKHGAVRRVRLRRPRAAAPAFDYVDPAQTAFPGFREPVQLTVIDGGKAAS